MPVKNKKRYVIIVKDFWDTALERDQKYLKHVETMKNNEFSTTTNKNEALLWITRAQAWVFIDKIIKSGYTLNLNLSVRVYNGGKK